MLAQDSLLEQEIRELNEKLQNPVTASDLITIRRAMVNYALAAQMDSSVRKELEEFIEKYPD